MVSAGTDETSPAICIGGKLCRIGRRSSVATGSSEVTVAAGVAAVATSNLPRPSGIFGACSSFVTGAGDNLKGILIGGAGAEGGTGGPLEAGTRGNADPPVPISKDFSGLSSTGSLGVTMRDVEPSLLGTVPIRLVVGATGGFTAGGG